MAKQPPYRKRRAGDKTPVSAAWRASRPGLFTTFIFGAVVNLLKFAMPIYLLQVLDRIPASRSTETLVLLTLLAVFAVGTGFALDIIRRRMLTHWGVWIERKLGPEVVRRGLANSARSLSFDLDRALSDLTKLRNFVSKQLVNWSDLVWAPLFLFGVYLIHPYLGMLAIGGSCLLLVFSFVYNRLSIEPRRASSVANRETRDLLSVASRNRESVGALGMGEILSERWSETAQGRLEERERIDKLWHTFRTLSRAVSQFMRIGLIGLGMWLVLRNELTLGGIFAARVMAGFGYVLLENAVRNSRGLSDARTAYQNVKKILEEQPFEETESHPETRKAALRIDNITHRHPGQRQDLYRRLSLDLAPGEILLVSGGGGVGKTTLTHLIVGLARPRFGKVFLGDSETADLPLEERNRLIGYLPQHTEIFSGTVRENIARMDSGSLVEVVKAAKLAGIHDFILSMPHGYDSELVPDTFDQLSGSQRKRIALARAFYERPRLLVLDEPSANLDSPSRRVMEASLRELQAGGATIVVTQSVRSSQLERMATKQLDLAGSGFELTSDQKAAKRKGKSGLRSVK